MVTAAVLVRPASRVLYGHPDLASSLETPAFAAAGRARRPSMGMPPKCALPAVVRNKTEWGHLHDGRVPEGGIPDDAIEKCWLWGRVAGPTGPMTISLILVMPNFTPTREVIRPALACHF
jgi:hypothetical protein